ncbi:MAG: hypothetical protein Q4B65_02640 [Candidatus Saccharibacteria bacterium]|nr:hypothetical protein [Candidatus Saccharibacteria bacterium]
MASIAKARRWWREKLRGLRNVKIKTWQLLIILIPLLFLDATLLRIDHLKMVELRDKVIAADEVEDDEAILASIMELKEFVFSNIVINVVEENGVQRVAFGTGPFYLENSYIRAANKALEEAEANLASDANPHGNIYALASQVCRPLAIQNGWAWDDANFINCMMGEIQKYPAAEDLQDKIIAALPSTELYRKEFASPVWAPTLAGFAILITAITVLVVIVRMIWWIILRVSLLFL